MAATTSVGAVTSLGGNTYKIVGVQSGRTLEVAGASTANGALVDIWGL